MLNPSIHDSRQTRQDTENVFSFLRFTVGFFPVCFGVFCVVSLMVRTHPFVPIACLRSQDECFSCIFNEAEVNMGMFV